MPRVLHALGGQPRPLFGACWLPPSRSPLGPPTPHPVGPPLVARALLQYGGYWETTSFLSTESGAAEVTFFDSVTGLPLFIAPRGRSWDAFVAESRQHMWPSFRDSEVVWANVRVVAGGETVSVNGTHLGHNLPDSNGNRYCINLVCVAGAPPPPPPPPPPGPPPRRGARLACFPF